MYSLFSTSTKTKCLMGFAHGIIPARLASLPGKMADDESKRDGATYNLSTLDNGPRSSQSDGSQFNRDIRRLHS